MSAWIWVRRDVVLATHDRALADHGGLDGMRDIGALESALDRPRNLAAYNDNDPDVADLAALYAVGLAKAHAFGDGNKRVAWSIARAFLRRNGYRLNFDKAEAVAVMIRVATGAVDAEELAAWFRSRLRKVA